MEDRWKISCVVLEIVILTVSQWHSCANLTSFLGVLLEELLFPFPWPYGTQLASCFASTTHEILQCCVQCSTSNLTPLPASAGVIYYFLKLYFWVAHSWYSVAKMKSINQSQNNRGCGKIFHIKIASQISLISFVTNPNHIIFGT